MWGLVAPNVRAKPTAGEWIGVFALDGGNFGTLGIHEHETASEQCLLTDDVESIRTEFRHEYFVGYQRLLVALFNLFLRAEARAAEAAWPTQTAHADVAADDKPARRQPGR